MHALELQVEKFLFLLQSQSELQTEEMSETVHSAAIPLDFEKKNQFVFNNN